MTTRLYTVEIVIRFAVLAESAEEAESFADQALDCEAERSPRAVLTASEDYMHPDAMWTDDCNVYGEHESDITFAEAVALDRIAAAEDAGDAAADPQLALPEVLP